MNFKSTLILTMVTLCGMMVLFEITPADIVIQDRLFDFDSGNWLVDRHAPGPRFLFYNLPKGLLIIFGIYLLLNLLNPGTWGSFCLISPKKALFLIMCLGLVPALVALAKNTSGVYCPAQITRYGGSHEYLHVLKEIQSATLWAKKGCCFPAGHASGGFALMSLCFAANRSFTRWIGFITGCISGWTMGLYQMFKGAHFLSHTLFTMVFAWLVIIILARFFGLYPLKRISGIRISEIQER